MSRTRFFCVALFLLCLHGCTKEEILSPTSECTSDASCATGLLCCFDKCQANCGFPQNVAHCGNGIQEGLEWCDEGGHNSDTLADACRSDCTLPRCGDGVLDSDEDCDAAEENGDMQDDGCRSDCTLPRCGDGVLDSDEECDAAEENGDTLSGSCRADCTLSRCGDGILDSLEDCEVYSVFAHGTCEACLVVCDEGYSGIACALCAAGYQDNDNDGTCLPGCDHELVSCQAHQTCVDGSGIVECFCIEPWQDADGISYNGCEFYPQLNTPIIGDANTEEALLFADGSAVLVGYFRGPISYHDVSGGEHALNASGEDGFVLKLDEFSRVEWFVNFSSEQDDRVRALVAASEGVFFVAGQVGNALVERAGEPIHVFSTQGSRDAFVAKIDTDGNLLWTDHFGGSGGSGESGANDIALLSEGAFVLVGESTNSFTFAGENLPGGEQCGFVAGFSVNMFNGLPLQSWAQMNCLSSQIQEVVAGDEHNTIHFAAGSACGSVWDCPSFEYGVHPGFLKPQHIVADEQKLFVAAPGLLLHLSTSGALLGLTQLGDTQDPLLVESMLLYSQDTLALSVNRWRPGSIKAFELNSAFAEENCMSTELEEDNAALLLFAADSLCPNSAQSISGGPTRSRLASPAQDALVMAQEQNQRASLLGGLSPTMSAEGLALGSSATELQNELIPRANHSSHAIDVGNCSYSPCEGCAPTWPHAHCPRKYSVIVADLSAGDEVELWVTGYYNHSLTGNSQNIYVRDFEVFAEEVYSTQGVSDALYQDLPVGTFAPNATWMLAKKFTAPAAGPYRVEFRGHIHVGSNYLGYVLAKNNHQELAAMQFEPLSLNYEDLAADGNASFILNGTSAETNSFLEIEQAGHFQALAAAGDKLLLTGKDSGALSFGADGFINIAEDYLWAWRLPACETTCPWNAAPPTECSTDNSCAVQQVLHLEMEETLAPFDFFDSSTANHTVVPHAQAVQIDAKFGQASAHFDGEGDALSLPASPDWILGNENFTIEGWVKLRELGPSSQTLLSLTSLDSSNNVASSSSLWTFAIRPGVGLEFAANYGGFFSAGLNEGTTATWDTYRWHHVAVSRSGNDFYLFHNGALVKEISVPDVNFGLQGYAAGTNFSATQLFVGARQTLSVHGDVLDYLKGFLDEVRITKGRARYTTSFALPDAPFSLNDDVYYDYIVMDTKLLLHMESEDPSEFVDHSHAQHSVSALGDVHQIAPKAAFGCGLFAGSGDALEIDDSFELNFSESESFTVELWLHSRAATQWQYAPVLAKRLDQEGPYYRIAMNKSSEAPAGRFFVDIFDGVNQASIYSEAVLNDGRWHHLAMVVDRQLDELRFYVDGQHQGEPTDISAVGDLSNDAPLSIAKDNVNAPFFKGYLDEVRLFSGSRYQENFTPNTSDG